VSVFFSCTATLYYVLRASYEAAHVEFSRLDLRPDFSAKDAAITCQHHTHAATKCDQKLEVVMNYEQQMSLDV
jgi:hypothetical protein